VRSNQKISEIMESIQDNLYVIDYDWNYVYINKQSAAALGMEPKDFIGQNHWEMFSKYRGTVLEDNFRDAMEKREVRRFEIHSPYNNNWFIVTVYPSAEGITVMGSNITERKKVEDYAKELLNKEQKLTEELQTSNEELKSTSEELHQHMNYLAEINKDLKQSEEKFFKAFNSNPAPMSLGDGHVWIDVNESFLKLTGYSKEELIGHTPAELNFIDAEKRKQYLTQSKRQGSKQDTELTIRTKSGEKRIVLSSIETIELDSENRYINFIHDITERKERELLSNALNEVNNYINSTLDYDEIMQLIVELGAKTLGAESSVINIREDDNWTVKYVYNFPNDIIGQKKTDQESPTSVFVANKMEATAFNDAQNDPRVNVNGMKMHGVASLLVAPIILKDKIKGIIAFYHHDKPVVFNDAQIDFSNKLASSLSQALENAALFDDIKKSEEKFSKVFHSNPGGMSLADVNGKCIDVNESFTKLTGYNKDELIGHSFAELNILNTEKRLQLLKEIDERGSFQYEMEMQTKSGEKRIVIINSEIIEINNELNYLSFHYDITERKKAEIALKKSEERFRTLADNIPNLAWMADASGWIFWYNKQWYDYTGTTLDEMQGWGWQKVHHPDYVDSVTEEWSTKLLEGEPYDNIFPLKGKDGDYRWFLTRITPIRDEYGKVQRWFGTNTDVTERKDIEDNLQTTMDELKQSNKELEQFAYITSHDLREPLRMITSFLQLLERRYNDQLDQDANEFIRFAVNGAKRLDTMTNDLLKYSQISNKNREAIPVNFEHVLEHALENLKVQIEENNAIITHDSLPTIVGDEELKVQLFQNIIGNAIKYRSQETPKIHISAVKEKNQYLFSIKDNGIGMSHKHLEKIFTIFQRLHTNEEYEGTGIGLAIAQKIVHQQGGQIWAESEPGKGTTFYFTIPF
jgi:PAS domain S-box-containing protein